MNTVLSTPERLAQCEEKIRQCRASGCDPEIVEFHLQRRDELRALMKQNPAGVPPPDPDKHPKLFDQVSYDDGFAEMEYVQK